MDLLDLFVKIGVQDEASDKVSSIGNKLKSGLASAGKVAAAGIGAVTAAAGAAVTGLLALEGATEEYRVAQGKLNTAFEAAGYSTDAAREAYYGFYGILGDTDTATEASQLLAQLVENEEDVVDWTDIAAGVFGTFGDSLPIEGLIEASNETAKVGQVTGVLADALNWVGISEDDFNTKLAACSSESERNQLIMETLSATYDDAATAFYKNNESLVQSRDAQTMLMDSMAKLGQTVSDVKTKLMSEFAPALAKVATAFSDMLSGTEGADEQFATAVGELVNTAVSKLPEFLNMGVQILTALASGIVQSIPVVVAAIPQLIAEIAAALANLLPQILDMGVQLLEQLVSGIETGLPDMLSRIPQVIEGVLSTFAEYFPQIINLGMELIGQIAEGIETGLPEFIAKLPQIIEGFLNFITEHLPDILDQGVQILTSLINGIVEAIPVLVENLPKIITSIVNFIAENLPKIVEAGISILVNLITGLIKAIPQLIAALPQIITAIVEGIGALMGSIVEIGADIVRGLWEGIKSMIGWIGDQVSGFFGGLIDGAKNLLGIHSPSTVFADMGKNMALGLGEGWGRAFPGIQKSIAEGMDFGTATATVDFASSGLGISSAGIINSVTSGGGEGWANGLTVNLTLPDGSKFATWQLPYLIKAGSAAGTPIAEAQRA